MRLLRAAVLVAFAAAGWASPAAAAPWCGTTAARDRLPQAIPGPAVHLVYVFPSDGIDRSGELAPAIHEDTVQIDAWWRSQDPARAPRFDLAVFACEPQVDLTVVRTSQTGAQLAPLPTRASAIINNLVGALLSGSSAKYLVYYDGPVDDPDTCGQGSGSGRNGPGYALVYLAACRDTSRAAVAAHELLHALGALPDGAPNACPDDRGHPCDSEQDILYPFASGSPLEQLLLDVARDDYYAHPGSWFDVQDSAWLRKLDRPQARLTLAVSGGGSVVTDPPSLVCAATCTTDWDEGSRIVLTARAASGRRLLRWTGACSGSSDCGLTLSRAGAVSAVFGPARFALTVAVAGHGVVRSAPAGLACRRRCTARFTSFTTVRLRATAGRGWRFARWSGSCRGTRRSCNVSLRAAASTRAVFVRR